MSQHLMSGSRDLDTVENLERKERWESLIEPLREELESYPRDKTGIYSAQGILRLRERARTLIGLSTDSPLLIKIANSGRVLDTGDKHLHLHIPLSYEQQDKVLVYGPSLAVNVSGDTGKLMFRDTPFEFSISSLHSMIEVLRAHFLSVVTEHESPRGYCVDSGFGSTSIFFAARVLTDDVKKDYPKGIVLSRFNDTKIADVWETWNVATADTSITRRSYGPLRYIQESTFSLESENCGEKSLFFRQNLAGTFGNAQNIYVDGEYMKNVLLEPSHRSLLLGYERWFPLR